jgi:hypothetical protein
MRRVGVKACSAGVPVAHVAQRQLQSPGFTVVDCGVKLASYLGAQQCDAAFCSFLKWR